MVTTVWIVTSGVHTANVVEDATIAGSAITTVGQEILPRYRMLQADGSTVTINSPKVVVCMADQVVPSSS